MNRDHSGKRLAYLGAVAALLVPMSYLSRPASITANGVRDDPGGYLAQLRDEHELQHSNLGELDPSTITLKLATFGVRQVAAALLRNKAEEYKSKQNWTALEATLDQAANLQPYYVGPWRYQAWNLSYNVSVEFDGWEGRYHYVKRGIKYLLRGSRVNAREHRLISDIGWFTGQKIGRSDERVPFRRKFRVDPDEEFPAHEQSQRTVRQRDNWLVAAEYYAAAEDLVENVKGASLGAVSPVVFYTQLPRSYINYAEALGRREEIERIEADLESLGGQGSDVEGRPSEGHDEALQVAVSQTLHESWTSATDKWRGLGDTRDLQGSSSGMVRLSTQFFNDQLDRGHRAVARLEELTQGVRAEIVRERIEDMDPTLRELVEEYIDINSPALEPKSLQQRPPDEATGQEIDGARARLIVQYSELAERATPENRAEAMLAAAAAGDAEALGRTSKNYREQSNYDYWLGRCEMESSPEAIAARYANHQALVARDGGDLIQAQQEFEQSFENWRIVLGKFETFSRDPILSEELFEAIGGYNDVLQQRSVPFPEDSFALLDWMLNQPSIGRLFMDDPEMYQKLLDRRERSRNPGAPMP